MRTATIVMLDARLRIDEDPARAALQAAEACSTSRHVRLLSLPLSRACTFHEIACRKDYPAALARVSPSASASESSTPCPPFLSALSLGQRETRSDFNQQVKYSSTLFTFFKVTYEELLVSLRNGPAESAEHH